MLIFTTHAYLDISKWISASSAELRKFVFSLSALKKETILAPAAPSILPAQSRPFHSPNPNISDCRQRQPAARVHLLSPSTTFRVHPASQKRVAYCPNSQNPASLLATPPEPQRE